MKKGIAGFIKSNWAIIAVCAIILLRFLISFNLPNFYLSNMNYDDALMVEQSRSLLSGNYLGIYSSRTLIKGLLFPGLLAVSSGLGIRFSIVLTVLYISACLYFVFSFKNILKNKVVFLILLTILLFNPVSYSADLFQRLYRNSLSIIELLFFLGAVIRIIFDDKKTKRHYFVLGLAVFAMYLTREDSIWTMSVLALLFGYKVYKEHNVKNILLNFIPVLVLFAGLNIVSMINYGFYNIYTYNELKTTNFKDAYKTILKIKENEKKDKIAINKETFYKIIESSDILGFDKEYVDEKYDKVNNLDGEIDNGNIVWYLRRWIDQTHKFKDGREANDYYGRLNSELNRLLNDGVFEKEFVIPSVFVNTPTSNEIAQIPKSLIDSFVYSTTYKNMRTIDKFESSAKMLAIKYDKDINAEMLSYSDYRNTDVMVDGNPLRYEIIRLLYKYFTIIFGVIAVVIFFKNIRKFDKLNFIILVILLSYLVILFGVSYTDATAFHAVRYMYLGNVYILQSLFILLNLYRYYSNKKASVVAC